MNDSERETGSPSPLEPLVRPEGTDSKRVPQDVKPEAIFLAILETQKRAWMFNSGLQPTNEFYKGGFVSLEIAIEALRERMDANSMPPA